jgi:hypothetical protein
MKTIRNLHELKMMKQKLKFQEMLHERELSGTTAAIVENFTDKLRELAFDLGSRMVNQFISGFTKKRSKGK